MASDFTIHGDIDLNDVKSRAQIDALEKYAEQMLGQKIPVFMSSPALRGQAGTGAGAGTMQENALYAYSKLKPGLAPSALGPENLTILAAYLQLLSQAVKKAEELNGKVSNIQPLAFKATGTGKAADYATGANQILNQAQIQDYEVAKLAYQAKTSQKPEAPATISVDADTKPAEATIGKLQTNVEAKVIRVHTDIEQSSIDHVQAKIDILQAKIEHEESIGIPQPHVYEANKERLKYWQGELEKKQNTYKEEQPAVVGAEDAFTSANVEADRINAALEKYTKKAARTPGGLSPSDQRLVDQLQQERASLIATIEALSDAAEGKETVGVAIPQQQAEANIAEQVATKAQEAYVKAQTFATGNETDDQRRARLTVATAAAGKLIAAYNPKQFGAYGAPGGEALARSTIQDAFGMLFPAFSKENPLDYSAYISGKAKSEITLGPSDVLNVRAAGLVGAGRKMGDLWEALRAPGYKAFTAEAEAGISPNLVGSAAALQEAFRAQEHPEWATAADVAAAQKAATRTVVGEGFAATDLSNSQAVANLEKTIEDRILNAIITALQNGEKLSPQLAQEGQRLGYLNAKGELAAGAQGPAGINIERNEDTRALTDTQGAVDTRNLNARIAALRSTSTALTRVGRESLALATTVGAAMFSIIKASDTLNFAESKLGQAMKATTEYSAESLVGFEDQARALLALSGDQVATTESSMAYAKSLQMSNEQVTALTPRVADISAAIGVDMQTAFKASSLALNGITTQMRRLGFYVEKGADGFVGLDDIMKATAGVAGMAEVHGRTLTGALDKLKGTVALVGASFGDTLSPAIVGFLDKTTTAVGKWTNLSDGLKKSIGVFGGVVVAITGVIGILGILGGAVTGVVAGLGALGIAGGAAIGGVALGVGGGILAGVATLAAIKEYEKWLESKQEPSDLKAVKKANVFGSNTTSWDTLGRVSRGIGRAIRGEPMVDEASIVKAAPRNTGYGSSELRGMGWGVGPQLSADAVDALKLMTDKMVGLERGNLASAQALLQEECDAMIALAGTAAASIRPTVEKYQKEQSEANIKAANMDINTRYAQIGMTDVQVQIDNLKRTINAEYEAGERTPKMRAEANAVIAAETKKIEEGAKKNFAPINVEGTNVSPLMSFIGSLQAKGITKPKPQEIELKLTWDGSSIRIDDKTWSSPQLASKMAAAVMKLAQSMVKNASLGG